MIRKVYILSAHSKNTTHQLEVLNRIVWLQTKQLHPTTVCYKNKYVGNITRSELSMVANWEGRGYLRLLQVP